MHKLDIKKAAATTLQFRYFKVGEKFVLRSQPVEKYLRLILTYHEFWEDLPQTLQTLKPKY